MELKKKKKIHFAAASGASGRQHRIYVFTHKEGDFLCGGEWLLSGMLRKKSFLYPIERALADSIAVDIRKDPELEVMVMGQRELIWRQRTGNLSTG